MDSNEWDINVPTEGDLESKLRAIERQLVGQVKEFIFVLDADTGEELYRDKGTFDGIFDTIALRNVLSSKRVIVVTHNHPSSDLSFSMKDLDLFFGNDNVVELRATSGIKTAILHNSNKSKPYTKTVQKLVTPKFIEKNFKKITNEEYNVWYYTLLPHKIVSELSLDISLIEI
jgi:hypothetical protein